MNTVYVIAIIIALFELIGIRSSLAVIAAAYLVWAKQLEKDANPLIVVTPGENEDKIEIKS